MSAYDMGIVDEIRRRLDATYEEALEGLRQSGGDLLGALAAIEEKQGRRSPEDGELVRRILRLATAGPVRAIRIRVGDREMTEIPLELGPWGSFGVSLLGVLLSEVVVEPVREEDDAPMPARAREMAAS